MGTLGWTKEETVRGANAEGPVRRCDWCPLRTCLNEVWLVMRALLMELKRASGAGYCGQIQNNGHGNWWVSKTICLV